MDPYKVWATKEIIFWAVALLFSKKKKEIIFAKNEKRGDVCASL